MRIIKIVNVSGHQVDVSKMHIRHDLNTTGRATFTITANDQPRGIVEVQIGVKTDAMKPYFLGVIEQSQQISGGNWHIVARELIGALSVPLNLSIRHATLTALTEQIARAGVEFELPEVDYTSRRLPNFCSVGTGLTALRQIGKALAIPNYIIQQLQSGKIYAGALTDYPHYARQINIPDHTLNTLDANSAEITVIPTLRAGLRINKKVVRAVTLAQNKQVIEW